MDNRHTLLIIDDDEAEILLAQRLLSRVLPEVKLRSATSGEEGLAWLRNHRTLPTLTLLDLKMPGIDGVETLRLIRADERMSNLLVVVMTNSNLEWDRDRVMAAGADAFFQKTLDRDRFHSNIQSVLRKLQQ